MLQSVQRPDPFFLADHRALDFLNSVATPQDERIDWLADGPSLLNWLSQGFGVSSAAVDGSREASSEPTRRCISRNRLLTVLRSTETEKSSPATIALPYPVIDFMVVGIGPIRL